jgi:hypothetical protein
MNRNVNPEAGIERRLDKLPSFRQRLFAFPLILNLSLSLSLFPFTSTFGEEKGVQN